MEPDFHDLALAKFLQSSPELSNMIVTFKDVSDELQDDVDIKVGVFILRSGEEVFYVPTVSKADNVYPIDSIFFASKSKFFPLTKKTVAMVVNSSQLTQGRKSKIPDTVVLNPDMTQLINPPRTGKFVAASTSRLGDFMAVLPDYLKTFTLEKISSEKSVYEDLHKMFSLRDIFASLQTPAKAMRAVTNQSPVSIVTGVSAGGLSEEDINAILENGYVVKGAPAVTRVAIAAQNAEDSRFSLVTELDGNCDWEVMFNRGDSREAFIPKAWTIGHACSNKRQTVAIFTNGDYAISEAFVSKGERLDRSQVLESVFRHNPPILPRDVAVGDNFAIIDTESRLLGIFSANKVTLSHLGVDIEAYMNAGFSTSGRFNLHAYRNFGSAPIVEGREVYMPYSTLVIRLSKDISMDLERSAMSANRKHEVSQVGLLGDQLNLSFDGVEFTVNGKVVGQEKAAMQRLVVEEGIDPSAAMSFVKQAREQKIARIYLTKEAGKAFKAGEIPQFGEQPTPPGKTGLNGSFIPNVQQSLKIGDAQATEATIISELLQTPDMFELIEEYMPDIEECIDRLGRILFLSRVHITKLSENNDADNVFSFLASLKAVYRLLGDNMIKLQELVALKPTEKK
jgi:hypothetical protein